MDPAAWKMVRNKPNISRAGRRRLKGIWSCLALLLVLIGLAACAGRTSGPGNSGNGNQIYRPPTAAIPQTPIVAVQFTPTATVDLRPTATAGCTNNLLYLQDLTVPDGTLVTAGQKIDKRWQVENAGTCNWSQDYRLQLIAGPGLGLSDQQMLYPARSGIEFSLQMTFTAPDEPGTYRSAWQAYDPQGTPFGDPVFVEVVVPAAP